MRSNFDFLKKDFPVLANFGGLAEQYCNSDSNSYLLKLWMIGETIVNLMFTYDRIPLPANNNAVNRINTLFREGLLTRDLSDILHSLRKIRNKAVHENYASVPEGKTLLQIDIIKRVTKNKRRLLTRTYTRIPINNIHDITPIIIHP